MHEVIITRGVAQGWRFEKYIQIFVPLNVVLLHEGKCHIGAQHSKEGWELCVTDILSYHGKGEILDWLDYLGAEEQARMILNF